MNNKIKLFLITAVTFILLSACKTVKINEEKFAWKSFDNSEKDQSVNFESYESPNNRMGQDPSRLVIICSSGGGSRAASFTTGIMLELEKLDAINNNEPQSKKTNVLDEIDYLSTVSGGGWGASSYIAYLYQKKKYSSSRFSDAILKYNNSLSAEKLIENRIEQFPTFNSYEKYLANRADFRYYKYQIPLIFTFRFGAKKSDMLMTNRLNAGYLGWSYREDIERKTWKYLHPGEEYSTNNVDEITLGDIFIDKGNQSYLPILIANATNIDNFKLVPFTPDRLKYWGVKKYRHYLLGSQNINDSSDIKQIPLASGTKASSGIPFAMSCSTFPSTKKDSYSDKNINYYLHLQDGGIVDQQAMHSAKSILNHHSEIKDKNKRIVFIIDASSTGIDNNKKFKKNRASRFYNLSRVMAPFSTPAAQYALTRERVKLFEEEYNCTVIYLGTEVLLDKNLNLKEGVALKDLPSRKKKVEEYLYKLYPSVQNSQDGFLACDINQRKLLFAYISQNVSTWFASNGSKLKGKIIEDNPESSAKIMFLAGRGVVQLKKDEIERIFGK
jgi:hypothetical protein